jgi:cell division control protein 6
MKKKALNNLFQEFLTKNTLFLDKKALQSSYTPETVFHRDKEIKQIANTLAPILRSERPSNIFIYGKTGTGKTLTIRYITNTLLETTTQKNIPFKLIYLNCKLKKIADTEYRLIAQIAREFGKAIPPTGLPTDEVYKAFFDALEKEKQIILLVLDEIDQLVKKVGDEILYNLTRINEELKNTQIAIIGISNDLTFVENLDPRVKSSLSEEEIVFPPYNALQIQDILRQRAEKAFKKDALEQGVIEKCSAYAAREHGDVRRALELLRVAGEIAERSDEAKLKIKHIDEADKKIEHDRIFDLIKTQPKQFQTTLYAILSIKQKTKNFIFTGEVYDLYKKICFKTALTPLTQRRISDILAEFDMLGIINAKVISKGRYGRTREISLSIPSSTIPKIKKVLEEELDLS